MHLPSHIPCLSFSSIIRELEVKSAAQPLLKGMQPKALHAERIPSFKMSAIFQKNVAPTQTSFY